MRLLGALLLFIACSIAVGKAEDATSPATIIVHTDGVTSTVEMAPGNGIYPIANSVEYEASADGVGSIVIVRVRIVPAFETRVFLPMVSVP